MGTLEALGMLCGKTVAQAVGASLLFCFAAMVCALIWARWFKCRPIEVMMIKLAGQRPTRASTMNARFNAAIRAAAAKAHFSNRACGSSSFHRSTYAP